VRQRADASPDPIGRLLGAWERDHDPKAADRLRALGILVPRGPVAES
jgi:hypothetical protein